MADMNPVNVLSKVFGYTSFRPHQEDIIKSILSGQDTVVLMPTGGGKSLCYQIPALVKEGTAIVISPLIALMKDQVDALRVNGVAAAYLNSSQSQEEQSQIYTQLRTGALKLLYLAPERLLGNEERFISFINELNISLLAIDEAHCISSWGHDFRPEYLLLAKVKKALNNVPLIALTATADDLTRQDIIGKLELPNPKVFITGFNRPNIQYLVKPKANSYFQLVEFLSQKKDDSGIIYTLRRKDTEELASRLNADGYSAEPYHAGLDRNVRNRHQELFLKDEVKIVVATIAFGMGIDKSNVRYVVHMDLPKNIESYYQETGRAGRDGLPSIALMFYSYGDFFTMQKLVEVADNPEQSEVMIEKLRQMSDYGSLKSCRRKFLLEYFSEKADSKCNNCDNCLHEYKKIDATIITQKALSAVTRIGQRFGANYVIDILRGSRSVKVREEHKQLKTYGVGADLSKEDWRHYINELINEGYLQRSKGEYPVLKLTGKSADAIAGKVKVELTEAIHEQPIFENDQPEAIHVDLIKILKRCRKLLADNEGVPAFVIFSDATLQELVTYLPQNSEELMQISGFGEVKVNRYGAVLLTEITNYSRVNGLSSTVPANLRKPVKVQRTATGQTYSKTFELFQSGKSMSEIAQIRGLALGTVESHLETLTRQGKLQAKDILEQETIDCIKEALKSSNQAGFKQVKEELGDAFSYGEIKIVAADMSFKKRTKP